MPNKVFSNFNNNLKKPKTLDGFDHIHHYWDARKKLFTAKILPGQCYVTDEKVIVVTTLGSCISACIRDTECGIGGMNHFMLPVSKATQSKADLNDISLRYGNYAMESLVNEVLKHGGMRRNLEVKIFGGGKILAQMTDIGESNIKFVKEYLKMEGLLISSSDVGGIYPRKIMYFPVTGQVMVKKLRSLHNNNIMETEKHYLDDIISEPVQGDIELFD